MLSQSGPKPIAPTAPKQGRENPLLFRSAFADEAGRAASLCMAAAVRPGEGPVQCFVALRERPLERLAGAAFWRVILEMDGTSTAEFEWSVIAAIAEGSGEREFLKALAEQIHGQCPEVSRIATSAWWPPGHPLATVVQAAGFSEAGGREFYQADAALCREAFAATTAAHEPCNLLRPSKEHFEALKDLLCGPSLRPSELAYGIHTAHLASPGLFDPRCSAMLTVAGKITVACLANASHGHLTLAALAGTPDDCALLLHHCLQARDHLPQSTSIGFHLDDRDPPGALAALMEQLPHQAAGQLGRYARPLAAAAGTMAEMKGASA